MIDIITNLINKFNIYASQNQVIAGAISLWGLTVLSYFCRNIPLKIWKIVKKQTTTKLTLINTHQSYYLFLKWLIRNNYIKNVRSLKINNGKWGDDKEAIKSLGYGNHFFIYKIRPFSILLEQVKNTYSSMERDKITITIVGRSHKFFQHIFDEIKSDNELKNEININKYFKYWQKAPSQYKRDINSIFIKNDVKNEILNHIKRFIENEAWYRKNGIPYQTGILLYGPPGTGKTSLIKAIASNFNKDIYVLPASKLLKIEDAIMSLPNKSILVIEDIDTDISTLKRINTNNDVHHEGMKPINETKKPNEELNDFITAFSNIGDVLNAIDGLITCNGRILIGTTNHKEKLSKALLRDGRFDLKIKLDNIDLEIFQQFFKNYYPDFKVNENIKLRNNISPAKLQNLILKNLTNPKKVIKETSI